MTNEKLLSVLRLYEDLLLLRGRHARRAPPDLLAVQMSRVQHEDHLLWMCCNATLFASEGRIEKAMRWLGFIQGAFWQMGLRTVEQMKLDNKPDGDEAT